MKYIALGLLFHRQKRSKGIIKNELEEIKGIGKETAKMLLKKFKSVKKIKSATEGELALEIGKSKATLVANHFKIKK